MVDGPISHVASLVDENSALYFSWVTGFVTVCLARILKFSQSYKGQRIGLSHRLSDTLYRIKVANWILLAANAFDPYQIRPPSSQLLNWIEGPTTFQSSSKSDISGGTTLASIGHENSSDSRKAPEDRQGIRPKKIP